MNRWQLVQDLFAEAAALAPAERARLLRRRAQADAELVRSVEGLLQADETPLATFERNATDLLQELHDEEPEPPAEELCGARFGSYRIEEHLSSGGMAHVYRATRTSAGTARRVAVKVLRPGLDTQAFLQRFQRERELLAGLEHEHIVSFLDAGALPDGRPFLVMELIEGVPLTRWGRGVALRRRLVLFLKVLAAVQYAHQQLVVHRDLKPSNVLVTAESVPKLLDFGIATVLERGAAADGQIGRGPLTPSYASPEQQRGEALAATTDVYSLGLLLHELATGALPQRGDSGVVVTAKGDLGAVLAKALAEEPQARYRSPDHFADDLRRLLASEAVSARRGSWAYRAALFARRHRWPVLLAASIVVALAVGWIGSDLERRRASAEASLGWGAHAQAKVVARVLEDWIRATTASDPRLGTAAAEHLELALEQDLSDLPEAETLLRLTLAGLYVDRGERARAAVHAERAWELARTTRGVGAVERERAAALLQAVRGE